MHTPHNLREEEEEALLPEHNGTRENTHSAVIPRFNGWKAHPYWLLPVVLVMATSRGVTMSPRIQVYKAIACRTLIDDSAGLNNLLLTAQCGDSEVQARAARIQASVVTIMSVLSAISTGFWSRLGDVHGRKPILCTFLVGALAMESVFVLVMRENSFFGRFAPQLILVGPILEGFVGGLSTYNGAVHAYITDCTNSGSRSKIFSTVQGIIFIGLAIGPWCSGLFLPKTGYSDGFFYTSITLLFSTILYVVFILPESKHPSVLQSSTHSEDSLQFKVSSLLLIRRQLMKFMSALLLPISMFSPRSIPGFSRKKDYNMTYVGLGYFFYCISIGVYSAKFLYAQHIYDWTTAELGYYMSTLWISKAFNLLVFLPIIISYLKPSRKSSPGISPDPVDIAAELKFDKYLVQCSLGVDGFADALVALVSNKSQPLFIALSCLSSFTSGGNPALHSLGAICLHAGGYGSEAGALFGALGVLSAVAHIIAPYIYALIYGTTVAYFPQSIFVLAATVLFTVVILLTQVRPVEGAIAMVDTPRTGERDERRHLHRRSEDYEAISSPVVLPREFPDVSRK